MTISPLSGGGGEDVVYGDFSGGTLILAITHPNQYVSHHGFRVRDFDSSGIFISPPGGTTANLGQEADNIAALLAPMYHSTTVGAFLAVEQTLADHTGQAPFPYTFSGAPSFTGSGAGADQPVPNVVVLASRGADGSRWRLTLPGPSSTIDAGDASRTPFPSLGGATAALVNYLTGQTNGGVHAVKTNVVTHNGVPVLLSPGNSMTAINKRLRRRFGLV